MLNEKKEVVPKLRQELKVKVGIVTSDGMKIYYTRKFQEFTARSIIKKNIKLVLKNIIKLAKGLHNNIFQDSFDKILFQQLTHDRSYISHSVQIIWLKIFSILSLQTGRTIREQIIIILLLSTLFTEGSILRQSNTSHILHSPELNY